MQICIDGRSISHPRRGGFKTYVENLVAALAQIPGEFEYKIVYDRPHKFPPINGRPHFEERVIPAPVQMFGQLYREHWALPHYSREIGDALWHFPYNRAPLTGIRNYVLTLHDVTPFMHTPKLDWSHPTRAMKELILFYYPRLLIRRSAYHAKAIITVSEYSRDQIIETLQVSPHRVYVTSLAAPPLFQPLSPSEQEEAKQYVMNKYMLKTPFLLTVASSLLKNPQGVVEAYAHLSEDLRKEYSLVIIMAHRRFASTIEQIADRHRVRQQARILINVAPKDLLLLYNLAEVLVYPSFTESYPLPTMEAMACGTPIICSNNTGFPEQVGDAALTVAPQNIEGISTIISQVLRSKDLRLTMARASLRRAKNFSWATTAQKTLRIYRELMGGCSL